MLFTQPVPKAWKNDLSSSILAQILKLCSFINIRRTLVWFKMKKARQRNDIIVQTDCKFWIITHARSVMSLKMPVFFLFLFIIIFSVAIVHFQSIALLYTLPVTLDFKMAEKSLRVLSWKAQKDKFSRQCKAFMNGLYHLIFCSRLITVGFLLRQALWFISLAISVRDRSAVECSEIRYQKFRVVSLFRHNFKLMFLRKSTLSVKVVNS